MKYSILVVDDNERFIESVKAALKNFSVIPAYSTEEAKNGLNNNIDLVLLDLVFDDSNPDHLQGLEFLPYISNNFPDIPVIVMTNYSNINIIVQAVKAGASDFFSKKELDWTAWKYRLVQYARSSSKIRELNKKTISLEREIGESEILGKSEEIEYVRLKLKDVAQNSNEVTLFLYGETGTGKNLAVRYFREHSHRKNKPYKEFSISELSPTVLESELFGHVKGAFTGAIESKIGLFEAANEGILFLDEIGDYDLGIQSKIMRFIENKTISPVGSIKEKILDLQLILATNKNLLELINVRKFREDLYQRINRIGVFLPPLRDRSGDIEELARHFFDNFRIKEKTNLVKISSDTINLLIEYSWPGNIRELQSVIWEACTNARLYNDAVLKPEHLRNEIRIVNNSETISESGNIEIPAIRVQLDAIENALKKCYGNKKIAAQLINRSPDQLLYFIKKKVWIKYSNLLLGYPIICKYYKLDEKSRKTIDGEKNSPDNY